MSSDCNVAHFPPRVVSLVQMQRKERRLGQSSLGLTYCPILPQQQSCRTFYSPDDVITSKRHLRAEKAVGKMKVLTGIFTPVPASSPVQTSPLS